MTHPAIHKMIAIIARDEAYEAAERIEARIEQAIADGDADPRCRDDAAFWAAISERAEGAIRYALTGDDR